MSKKISNFFIKDLLSRSDIVHIISTKIQLKKKGKNYYAFCPFHEEKTPSFSVSQEKQFFYCFGCGIHGNVIDFLINYENLNFIETIEELSNQIGLKIPYTTDKNLKYLNYRKNLYYLMEQIKIFYEKNLLKKNAKKALFYLKKRGLTNKIVKKFSIGYALPEWSSISNKFGKNEKIKLLLKNVGMSITSENGYTYDRFRSRIMFPIRDKYGNITGFGGRSIDNIFPKYLNSPETEIFHKSVQLYGLYEIYQKKISLSYVLVVEGYMDVISLTQFGIKYVVASLGTITTKNHIQTLFRITNTIIFCYDGDYAGRKAAWRTLKISLPYIYDGRQIKFIFLPENKDPDSLIREEGKAAFINRINKSISFSSFLFSILIKKIEINNYAGKIKLTSIILPMINQIPGEICRIYMRQKLGKKLGILDDSQLNKFFLEKRKKKYYISIKYNALNILIALLIQNTKLAFLIPSLSFFKKLKNEKKINFFLKLVSICKFYPNLNTVQLLELYRNTPFYSALKKFAFWNHLITDTKIENTFKDILIYVKKSILEKRYNQLLIKSKIKTLSSKEKNEVWLLTLKLKK